MNVHDVMARVGRVAQLLAMVVGALILLFILVETIDVARSTPSTPMSTDLLTAGSTTSCRPEPCGDAAGFQVFVNRVDRPAPGPARAGTPSVEYVRLEVSFANRTADLLAVSLANRADPADFTLRDARGVVHQPSFTVAPGCEAWSTTQVNRNATYGPKTLCFQTTGPANAPLALIWTPDVGLPFGAVEIGLP